VPAPRHRASTAGSPKAGQLLRTTGQAAGDTSPGRHCDRPPRSRTAGRARTAQLYRQSQGQRREGGCRVRPVPVKRRAPPSSFRSQYGQTKLRRHASARVVRTPRRTGSLNDTVDSRRAGPVGCRRSRRTGASASARTSTSGRLSSLVAAAGPPYLPSSNACPRTATDAARTHRVRAKTEKVHRRDPRCPPTWTSLRSGSVMKTRNPPHGGRQGQRAPPGASAAPCRTAGADDVVRMRAQATRETPGRTGRDRVPAPAIAACDEDGTRS